MFDASLVGEVVGVACAGLFQALACAIGGCCYDTSAGTAGYDFGGEVIDGQGVRGLSQCVTHARILWSGSDV